MIDKLNILGIITKYLENINADEYDIFELEEIKKNKNGSYVVLKFLKDLSSLEECKSDVQKKPLTDEEFEIMLNLYHPKQEENKFDFSFQHLYIYEKVLPNVLETVKSSYSQLVSTLLYDENMHRRILKESENTKIFNNRLKVEIEKLGMIARQENESYKNCKSSFVNWVKEVNNISQEEAEKIVNNTIKKENQLDNE